MPEKAAQSTLLVAPIIILIDQRREKFIANKKAYQFFNNFQVRQSKQHSKPLNFILLLRYSFDLSLSRQRQCRRSDLGMERQ